MTYFIYDEIASKLDRTLTHIPTHTHTYTSKWKKKHKIAIIMQYGVKKFEIA